MALSFTISGVSARGTGLPLVEQYLDGMEGFPARNLAALYLMQDGVAGQPYSGPIADRGQYARTGALIAGSVAQRTAAGMGSAGTGETVGYLFDTGLRIDGSFTIGVVTMSAQSAPSGGFPAFWVPAAQAPSVPLADGAITKGPLLDYGIQNTAGSAFNASLYRFGGWAPGGEAVKDLLHNNLSTTRVAIGLSYNAETGLWTIANLQGRSTEWYDKPAGDELIASGTTHALGATKFFAGSPSGELDIAAIYSRAKTPTEMQPMLTAMQTIVAARGVTVL